MKRVIYLSRLKEGKLAEYLEAHEPVWPEMLAAMHEAGIRNYSIAYREDGLLVGYFEAEDPDESLRRCAATDVGRRWAANMAPYFGKVAPHMADGEPLVLKEYFHMP